MATPHRSTTVTAIVNVILNRIRRVLGKLDSETPGAGQYVRLVVTPNPTDAAFKAEEGVHVVIGSPLPESKCINGRFAAKVKRPFVVHVVSENLLDEAGSDLVASLAHLALEESVIDAIFDGHPLFTTDDKGPAVQITWVSGNEQARMTRKDTALIHSVMQFEMVYAFPFTVS